MNTENRRQFARVLFESNFEVRTETWSDPAAKGLDISLSGCRFNCEQSMLEGEKVSITFKSGFNLEGEIRWCWPIEWYYLAAVHFGNLTKKEKEKLKTYIEEETGKVYQMEEYKSKEDENINVDETDIDDENIGVDETDIDDENIGVDETDIDDENLSNLSFDVIGEDTDDDDNQEIDDDLLNIPPLEENDLLDQNTNDQKTSANSFTNTREETELSHKFDGKDLSPLIFKGKKVVIFDMEQEQADLLNQYLSERIGMEVDYVTKKQNLWRHLKIDPYELVILESGDSENSDPLEVMQQTKDQFQKVQFICISGPVSLERKILFLNAGALDYLTRPIHLSTIAQSILVHFSRLDFFEKEKKIQQDDKFSENINKELPNPNPSETFHDEDLSGTLDLLDEDLNVSQEIELIDEEF